jgi:hypothetical protein
MNKEAEKILETIEVSEKDAQLFELRQRALSGKLDEAKKLTEELSHKEKSHILGHNLYENQPYYYLFEAYAHYTLSSPHNEAIDRASRAASLFHMRNSQWNEALVHWFLSILYEERGRKEESCKELQTSIAILEGIAKGFQHEGRVQDCQDCQKILRNLYRSLLISKSLERVINQVDQKNYLLLPWIPIYNSLQGIKNNDTGKEIHFWDGFLKNVSTRIYLISFDDNWYAVRSVSSLEGKIVIDQQLEYGWARVDGNDMNAASPVSLEEGDYVLFIKAGEAAENAIVVASRWKDAQKSGLSYMVRKLGNKILSTESTEKGEEYDPILVSDENQILGYVVAVAKPLSVFQESRPDGNASNTPPQESTS